MAEATIYILFLLLSILVQRSACLPSAVEPSGAESLAALDSIFSGGGGATVPELVLTGTQTFSVFAITQTSTSATISVEPSNTQSLAGQTSISSATIPPSSIGGVASLPTSVPETFGNEGFNFVASSSLGVANGGYSFSVVDSVSTGSTLSQLVLTGTQTFSAESEFFVATTTTQTSTTTTITVVVPPTNPSPTTTTADVTTPAQVTTPAEVTTTLTLPSNPAASILPPLDVPSSQGVPPIVQLPSTSLTSSQFSAFQFSTPTFQISTSDFGNAVHVSATLSPSTTIFTASTSFSVFTTDGHTTSSAIPILSTSVTMVPVPVPTGTVTSAQTRTSKSSGPSTSVAIGIALAGVAVFLSLILCHIVNRRRTLRKRAFLRLGEEI